MVLEVSKNRETNDEAASRVRAKQCRYVARILFQKAIEAGRLVRGRRLAFLQETKTFFGHWTRVGIFETVSKVIRCVDSDADLARERT